MPFDSNTAREAANKRWEKQRQLEELQKDYGIPAKDDDGRDLGEQLPTTRNILASGIAEWPDPIYDLDPHAYSLIRRCPAVYSPMKKLAIRISKLDWVVEDDESGLLQKALDNTNQLPDAIEWLLWALIEGVRFMYMEPLEIDGLVTTTFHGGGRRKIKAGGRVQWDGSNLVTYRETTGIAKEDSEQLNRKEWMVFRPGAGSSPEGEADLGLVAYDVAKDYLEARKNMAAYMDLHGLPIRVFKKLISNAQSSVISGIFNDAAEAYEQVKNNVMMVMSDEDTLELLEPSGKGFEDMTTFTRYLSTEMQVALLGNTLTSDTADSGPSGSSQVHLSEEDEYVYFHALQIADVMTDDLLPWLAAKNGIEAGKARVVPKPQGLREDDRNEDRTDPILREEDRGATTREPEPAPSDPSLHGDESDDEGIDR